MIQDLQVYFSTKIIFDACITVLLLTLGYSTLFLLLNKVCSRELLTEVFLGLENFFLRLLLLTFFAISQKLPVRL